MRNECKLMIGALAQAVAGKPLTLSEPIDWAWLCNFADAHKVAPLVYDGLQKVGIIMPEDIKQRLHGAYMQAIFRDSQLEYTRQQLSKKLTENKIPHIFLKGAVLKYDYPIPALRTMCDLDVLVYARDFSALDKIAREMSGQSSHSDGNHRNYAFFGGVTVEFHPNLLHHDTPVGTGINPGWQYAKNAEDIAGELTAEGFYLNTLCHLANHFVAGGVGVRFVLDVWVNRHLRKTQMDRAKVEKELADFGLLEFAHNIEALAEFWFGEAESSPILDELGEYILSSGLHGSTDQAVLNAIALSPRQNQASALMKKAFFSRAEMEDRFPWCKDKPWLLPIAWIVRATKAVWNHGSIIIQWCKGASQFSKEEISAQIAVMKRFGIDTQVNR